jgi:CubicO group peptidase (beta-lactamase class C family)
MIRLTSFLTATTTIALLAGAGIAQTASVPLPAPAAAPATASPLPATQALYDSYVATNKMPGIVGAFGGGDLPTVFVSAGKVATDAKAAPAGPDSLWRVAFKTMRVQLNENTIDSRPAARPITIRNLLTHTAGLGYNIITKGPLLQLYIDKGITPGQVNAAMEVDARKTRPTSLQEFADRVASVPLIADPGTKWSYSIGLDLMGAVIEKASGMRFDAFVQQRIFDPLKMKSSYWTVPASEVGRLSTNYAFLPGDKLFALDPAATSAYLSPPSFPYGGAGLVMSARDYDTFLHMLQNEGELDGVRIMKPETAKLAMSNLLPAGVEFGGVAGATGGTAGPKMGYGAGGSVVLEDKANSMGAGTYGWGGAAGTAAWVNPVKKIRGTIMVNYFPADKWPIRDETVKALISDMQRFKTK